VSDYGFIAPDEGGPDRYLRGGNFAGTSSTLLVGSRVEFDPREGGMGPEAINVRRVAPIRRRSSGSFEPARRRGALDPRFPRRPSHATAPPVHAAVENGNDVLGWYAFVARFFPGRNRHDLEALEAFESYGNASGSGQISRQQADAHPDDLHTLARSSASERNPPRSGHGRLPVTKTPERPRKAGRVAAAAVSDWEGEGGAP
jgi:cold shock CspA family protein